LVEVTLVDGTVDVIPLQRLTRLYDGMDQVDDMWGDEDYTESGSDYTDEVMEVISEDPPLDGEEEGGEWEDVDDEPMDSTASGDWAMSDDPQEPEPASASESGATTPQPPPPATAAPAASTPAAAGVKETPAEASSSKEEEEEEVVEVPWERFAVLPEAPPDHAFMSTTPTQPSRNFMTRLTKEYRVLSSSLPGSPLRIDSVMKAHYLPQTLSSCAHTRTARICCAV
jgi:ubiquitin-conjugating enzyme E2 O